MIQTLHPHKFQKFVLYLMAKKCFTAILGQDPVQDHVLNLLEVYCPVTQSKNIACVIDIYRQSMFIDKQALT